MFCHVKIISFVNAEEESHIKSNWKKMLTNDGKCVIESIWAKIETSRCEEERQHWRSELKQKWPGMICGGADEPEWDKRDLVNLYEDINFRGNLQGTKLLPEELTPEFKEFKQLPSYYTEVRRSTFVHTTYNGQVVNSENEVRTEETLYWMCVSPEDLRDRMVRVGWKRQKMNLSFRSMQLVYAVVIGFPA